MPIELINQVALALGYGVLGLLTLLLAGGLYMRQKVSNVSPEAKKIAQEANPNNDSASFATSILAEHILQDVRDLQPNEAVRADPEPLMHFDWSLPSRNARQEHIEHILRELSAAGYYVCPLPSIDDYHNEAYWDSERAGVWLSEPDWHIVKFDKETGRKSIEEDIEVTIPDEWEPNIDECEKNVAINNEVPIVQK